MNQRGGDAIENAKLANELKQEKQVFQEAVKDGTMPNSLRRKIYPLLTFQANRNHIKTIKNYKQNLLQWYKSTYGNLKKENGTDFDIANYFKYEKEKGKTSGGKRKTRKGKKSRRATRRRR